MDTNVYDFLEMFKKIDIKDEILFALEDNAADYTQRQREQMLKGERGDGKKIFRLLTGSDEYSDQYAKKKGKKKPIDLHATGDFQSEIFMDVRDEELFIDSADPKSGMLQKDYGDQIFGLQDEATSEFAETTGEKLVLNIEKKLS